MIQLVTTTEKTLAPNETLIFDEVILRSGCGECHRKGSGTVKMRANGIYNVHFHGNIGGAAAGAVQLSAQLGGETLPDTTMISTTAAAGDLNNVAMDVKIKNCCGDYDRIAIVNTGTTELTVGVGAVLSVNRLS